MKTFMEMHIRNSRKTILLQSRVDLIAEIGKSNKSKMRYPFEQDVKLQNMRATRMLARSSPICSVRFHRMSFIKIIIR